MTKNVRKASSITYDKVYAKKLSKLFENETLSETAEKLEVSPALIGFWKNGQNKPNYEKLCLISEKYNVSVDWILGISDVKNPEPSFQAAQMFTGLSDEAITFLKECDNDEKEAIELFLNHDSLFFLNVSLLALRRAETLKFMSESYINDYMGRDEVGDYFDKFVAEYDKEYREFDYQIYKTQRIYEKLISDIAGYNPYSTHDEIMKDVIAKHYKMKGSDTE